MVAAGPRDNPRFDHDRNKGGGVLEGCNPLGGGWTGHRLLTTPTWWSDSGLRMDSPLTCHTDCPEDSGVQPDLIAGVRIATMTLLDKVVAAGRCHCVCVSLCPGLGDDRDVDVDDWRIVRGFVTGPTSGRANHPVRCRLILASMGMLTCGIVDRSGKRSGSQVLESCDTRDARRRRLVRRLVVFELVRSVQAATPTLAARGAAMIRRDSGPRRRGAGFDTVQRDPQCLLSGW